MTITVEEVQKKYPRLDFQAGGERRLQEVVDFLNRRNDEDLSKKFFDRLEYLNGYAGDRSKGCRLYHDLAPLSFGFTMLDANGAWWFNGGLIHHGAGDTGVGAPSFSVRLTGDEEDWSIHT